MTRERINVNEIQDILQELSDREEDHVLDSDSGRDLCIENTAEHEYNTGSEQ